MTLVTRLFSTPSPGALATPIVVLLALFAASCAGGDDAPEDGRPMLPRGVTTAGAGEKLLLDGTPFTAVLTLPASALSAEKLESGGTAEIQGGGTVPVARVSARVEDVAPWELVSAAEDGWRVWRPDSVLAALAAAGAGATLVSVESVDWPDACLGAPRQDELCATVVTPGYRIIIGQDGEQTEYHTDIKGNYRIAARTLSIGD